MQKLHIGTAYYPEHWSEDRWQEDIGLMKETGFTVVRMGEFAWSTLEPAEDEFRFDWLDEAIKLLSENGILSVIGTPTAAPPAWLTQKYPNTLAVDENGFKYEHGKRCHYCVNSNEYHERTQILILKLAEHFGDNPNIIGWQIDNEFGTYCYCNTCRAEFQTYLMHTFESLDSLNETWTTRYWSQSYSSWDQIPIPKNEHNPGLMLAFQQFITHSYRKYLKLQVDILRTHISDNVWITHNFMNWFSAYDHYDMSAELDLASWDWYVPTGQPDYRVTGASHDLVRGFKRKNFWLMETQPGNVNWTSVNNHVDKGVIRAMAWHAVGHGANAVLYWQWRSALSGQEQYHGSLVDQAGQPRPVFDEIAQIGSEFDRISELLSDSEIKADVAILNDYNSRWSIEWQRQHQDFDYVAHLLHYYKPLAARNIPVDIISPNENLDGYRLVIVPSLVIITHERTQKLIDYVECGGTILLTVRCGMKDGFNSLLPSRQPGLLAESANVEVEEYYPLDESIPISGKMIGESYSKIWAERLRIIDENKHTQVIARYQPKNGWLDDQIAITYTQHGRGGIYYVGAYLTDAAQIQMMNYITKVKQVNPELTTPQGVEVCVRTKPDSGNIYILINHNNENQDVIIPWDAEEHISSNVGKGPLTISPYGVAVLTKVEV